MKESSACMKESSAFRKENSMYSVVKSFYFVWDGKANREIHIEFLVAD